MTVTGWAEEYWLAAVVTDVGDDEVRRWWNLKDTPLLDHLLETSPGFRLGTIVSAWGPEDDDPPGPVRRVHSLMFLRGTIPEDFGDTTADYVLPLLDAELRAALLAAFTPQPGDHPVMESASPEALATFLDGCHGARLTTHAREEGRDIIYPAPASVEDSPKAHVVAGLLRDGDRVLLCHRTAGRRWYPDVWDLPGGHVEPGERPGAALARELREELGIDIPEPSGPPLHHIDGDTFAMQIWLIETWSGSPVNREPDEHDAIGWFTADSLGDLPLAHDSLRAILA